MNSNASDNGNGNKIAVAHERVGLMKHLCTVSLAALLYISKEFQNLCAFEVIVGCFFASVLGSVMACILYVANLRHSLNRRVKKVLKFMLTLAIGGLLAGSLIFLVAVIIA